MTFLTPLSLLGLVLLPILVVLHLLRRRYHRQDVPSTMLWRELREETQQRSSRLRLQSLPLLLLQLLAVALLVGSLARPASTAAPFRQIAVHIYVVDASARMGATDLKPNRFTVEKAIVDRGIGQAPSGTRFTIIVASAQPYLLVSGTDPAEVRQALSTLAPTPAGADFVMALRLAAGLLTQAQQRTQITVLHAIENPLPQVRGGQGVLTAIAVGRSVDNQSILHFSVRCPVATAQSCTTFAAIRNEADQPVRDGLIIRGDGDVLARQSLALAARADTELSFPIPQGQHILEMQLTRPDFLPIDNQAWTLVGTSQPTHIALVGNTSATARIRQALQTLPNVTVHAVAPKLYSSDEAQRSDLLILDGFLPAGGSLPQSPAILLINPPSLPGGRVGGSLADGTVSGTDAGSALLSGVDLTSLDVPSDAAEDVTLPPWVAPVVWASGGPLLAAGSNGAQRLAVLSFDPTTSNLPQLGAFPLLLWNLVRWSQAWVPANGTAGEEVLVPAPPPTTSVQLARVNPGGRDLALGTTSISRSGPVEFDPARPGVYAITERETWGNRTAEMAVNADTQAQPVGTPVQIELAGTQTGFGFIVVRELSGWWPWIGLIALLFVVTEWLYVAWREG